MKQICIILLTVSYISGCNKVPTGRAYLSSHSVIQNPDRGSNTQSGGGPTSPPNGGLLYTINCSSCHGSLEASTKRGRTSAQIQSAISIVPSMSTSSTLKALSPSEIQAIAEALSSSTTPPESPSAVVDISFQQPLGGRRFMGSKMKSIFSKGNSEMDTIINTYTNDLGRVFGGICNRTMPDCRGSEVVNLNAEGVPTSNVLRNGYRIKACEAVLEKDLAVTNALSTYSLNSSSPRNSQNISLIFKGLTSSDPESKVLEGFSLFDSATGNNGLQSWRMILLVICKSSLFENF